MKFESHWYRGNHSKIKSFSCKIMSMVYIGCGFYNVVLCHILYFAFVNSGSRIVYMKPYNVSLTITGGLFCCAAWSPLAITTILANNIRNKFFLRKFLIIFAAHIIMVVSWLLFWIILHFAPAVNSVPPLAQGTVVLCLMMLFAITSGAISCCNTFHCVMGVSQGLICMSDSLLRPLGIITKSSLLCRVSDNHGLSFN